MNVERKMKNLSLVKVAILVICGLVATTSSLAKDIPGASPTSYSVSAGGQFRFSIPIVAPTGRRGVTPSLSINYSGAGAGSSLGSGWGIGGFPAITRCASTIATDGVYRGVQHDDQDKFCLNGRRLVLESGQYGAAGSEYRTELDTFARIEAIGAGSVNVNGGTSPSGFRVYTKSGGVFTYGSSNPTGSDSAQYKLPGTNSIHTWKLSKMSDRWGNSYSAFYRAADGLPHYVGYTLENGSYQQRINFNYEARPDARSMYVFGSLISNSVRLNNVTVENNGAQLRKYNFNYDQDPVTARTRLQSIVECGTSNASATCLPPINIDWKQNTAGYSLASQAKDKAPDNLIEYYTYTQELPGAGVVQEPGAVKEIVRGTWADVNGDGRTDMVIAVRAPNGSETKKTYIKTDSGWDSSQSQWHLPQPLRSYDNAIVNGTTGRFASNVINRGQLVDFNGDGLVDIIYSNKLYTDNHQYNTLSEVRIAFRNTGNGWVEEPNYRPSAEMIMFDYISNGSTGAYWTRMETVRARLIDVNNDGLPDWVSAWFDYVGNGTGVEYKKTWLNTGSGWTYAPNYNLPDVFTEYRGPYTLNHGTFLDANGDGRVDWVQSYHASGETAQRNTYLNNGAGFDTTPTALYRHPSVMFDGSASWSHTIPNLTGSFVDVNGDGRPDWVRSYKPNSVQEFKGTYLNTGRGWQTTPNAGYEPEWIHSDHTYAQPGRNWPVNVGGVYMDVNADGLVDYVQSHRSSASGLPTKIATWLNTGSGWGTPLTNSSSPYVADEIYFDYSGREKAKFRRGGFVDINHDGASDWVVSRTDLTNTSRLKKTPRITELDKITTTLGVEVNPTYASLTTTGLYEKKPAGAVLADKSRFIAGPGYVVSSLSVTDPRSISSNTSYYEYGGAQVHREGRGFLGYYKRVVIGEDLTDITATDIRTVTTSLYNQAYPFTGRMKESKTEITEYYGLNNPIAKTLISKAEYDYTKVTDSQNTSGTEYVYAHEVRRWSYEYTTGEETSRVVTEIDMDKTRGNVEKTTTSVFQGNALKRKTVSDPDYVAKDTPNWWLAQLDTNSITYSSTEDGTNSITVSSDFDFASSYTGELKEVVRQGATSNSHTFADTQKLVAKFDYDQYGNTEVTQQIGLSEEVDSSVGSTASEVQTRSSNFAFGPITDSSGTITVEANALGRLPTSIKNALDHAVTVKYHDQCDLPTEIIDANDVKTTITYDELCREKTVQPGFGEQSTTTYTHYAACPTSEVPASVCAQGVAFSVKTEFTGSTSVSSAPVTQYYNKYLQPIFAVTEAMAGQSGALDIEQLTEYDEFGRVVKESQPYFGNSAEVPQYTLYDYDVLGRVTKMTLPFTGESGLNHQTVAFGTDEDGNRTRVFTDIESNTTTSYANALGQVIKIVDADNGVMQYRYRADGSLVETEDHLGNIIQVGYDVLGRRKSLNDPDLGLSSYVYNAFNELVEQTDAKNQTISMRYDVLGRLTQRTTPITGGASNVEANGGTSYWYYDKLFIDGTEVDNGASKGALTKVVGPSYDGSYQNQAVNNYEEHYYYDSYGRFSSSTTKMSVNGTDHTFSESVTYQAGTGFLATRSFPESGAGNAFGVQYHYSSNGYLNEISSLSDQLGQCVQHWRANEYDALGRIKNDTLGGFIDTNRGFKPGQNVLESIVSTLTAGANQGANVQNLSYTYDGVNNVRTRSDALLLSDPNDPSSLGVTESFDYDSLYRLTHHFINGVEKTEVRYNKIGNITYKSDVGDYDYGLTGSNGVKAGPHAVSRVSLPNDTAELANISNTLNERFNVNWEWDGQLEQVTLPQVETPSGGTPTSNLHGQIFKYDENGNVLKSGDRHFEWTSFDKPSRMVAKQADGTYKGNLIVYDPSQNRVYKEEAEFFYNAQEMEFSSSNAVERTIYFGKYYERIERQTDSGAYETTHRYSINVGGSFIQIERADNSAIDKPKYFLADNLGSTNVVIDKFGMVEQRMAFDPWGMRLNVGDASAVNGVTNKGYTGHEMDDEVGVINMNARIYDPYLGRFLSADPVLPDMWDMQAFNRYSYVRNNPLSYVDPTGNSRLGPLCDADNRCVVFGTSPLVTISEECEGYMCRGWEIVDDIGPNPDIHDLGQLEAWEAYENGTGPRPGGETPADSGGVDDVPNDNFDNPNSRANRSPEELAAERAANAANRDYGGFQGGVLLDGIFWQDVGEGLVREVIFEPAKDLAEGRVLDAACKIFRACKGVETLVKGAGKVGGKLIDKFKSPCKGQCFVAGTLVLTSEGLKAIEDIEVGDMVAAIDDDDSGGEVEWKPVTETFINKNRPIVKITFTDNATREFSFEATPDHPFWVVDKGWLEVQQFSIGDTVVDHEGEHFAISEIVQTGRFETTYNFTVADFHTYFVGEEGIWVHNCPQARKGASTTLTTPDGDTVVGNSTRASRTGGAPRAPMNDQMQKALDKVENPSGTHGACCEIDAMNKVLNKGGNLRGSKMGDVIDNKTGATKGACSTCKDVKEQFGVE